MNRLLRRVALTLLLALPLPALAIPATGYWWNPASGGSGFVIEVQGNTMFLAGFLYATSGEATWVASTGPMTSATQYAGSLITFTGGQTLTGSYATPQQSAPLGNIALTFSDDAHASMTWPGGTVPIMRYDFGPGGSESPNPSYNPQTGWWWNQNEGGRGFAIEIQGNALYFAGYMYDTSGNPVWYLSTGNMVNPTLYQGVWQQFADGPALIGPYKSPTTASANVGNITLQVESPGQATLTLPDGRQIPFIRYIFGQTGPTLSSFSAVSAAPTAPLVIYGSGIDTTAALSLTFYDNTGYRAVIPLAAASTTSVQAGVPPYVNVTTGALGSGPVYVKLTQTSLGVSVDSNSLDGFTIQPMPAVPAALGPPGTLSLALLRAELAEAQRLKPIISSSAIGTGALVTAMGREIADLQVLVNGIQGVVQGGSFSLGAVNGLNLTLTPANIGDSDQLILATLNTLATPPSGESSKKAASATTACGQQEAAKAVADFTDADFAAMFLGDVQNLVEAPEYSPACSLQEFLIFQANISGAAGVTLGLLDDAGAGSDPARLPGDALGAVGLQVFNFFSYLNGTVVQTPAEVAAAENELSALDVLFEPAMNELGAKITAPLATYLGDSPVGWVFLSPYTGYVTGSWKGVCGGKNVSGLFSMTLQSRIDPQHVTASQTGVTGIYDGDKFGFVTTGSVDELGNLTADGATSADFTWTGELVLTPGTFSNHDRRFFGSSGTFTDKMTCDGAWSVP